jgi:hypothetical protein
LSVFLVLHSEEQQLLMLLLLMLQLLLTLLCVRKASWFTLQETDPTPSLPGVMACFMLTVTCRC